MNYLIAFLAGIQTFVSPCLLPMLSVYLAYIAGNFEDEKARQINLIKNSLGFVLGFSITFTLLGQVAATFGAVVRNSRWFEIIAGIIVILFGLFYLGKIKIPFLEGNRQIKIKTRKNFWGSVLFGIVFSLGWTPCATPFIAQVLILATEAEMRLYSVILTLIYSLGLGLPFILLAIFFESAKGVLKFLESHAGIIRKIGGAILIITGILLAIGSMRYLGSWLS